jgi:hypothetical protein
LVRLQSLNAGFLLLFVLLPFTVPVYGQTLRVETKTTEFTDYILTNDSLKIGYQQEITVPSDGSDRIWRILEQEIVSRALLSTEIELFELITSTQPENSPTVYTSNRGMYRKQWVENLVIQVSRPAESSNQARIVKHMRIRVYNQQTDPASSSVQLAREVFNQTSSPLANGTWYRIPIRQDGIYQLDRNYLQSLGINVGSIDPRRIQIWTTPGYEMPRLNSIPRPEFRQVPILVNGESDGSFDAADVVLFYGNSPDQYLFNEQLNQFTHSVHPYSATNFVFLTVGPENGLRLTETTVTIPASQTITTFTDFIWKEEELRRPDNRTKSGTQWLGQQFTPETFARTQTILNDTIPGFVQGSTIEVYVEYVARANQASRFDTELNGTFLGTVSITGIPDLNSSTGRAANIGRLSRILPNVTLQNNIITLTATFNNSNSAAFGWLDWIRLRVTRELRPKNNRLHYFTPSDRQPEEFADYVLRGFTNRPIVLDVTNPVNPIQYSTTPQGSEFIVRHHTRPGSRFVAQTQFLRPEAGSRIDNQNLRGITDFPDFIIITNQALLEEARNFADYRRSNSGWNPIVVRQDHIFNEFNGGVMDVSAIRDYIRYLYLRAGNDQSRIPRHVLFFGDATYDYKGIQATATLKNQVITFQSFESLNRTDSYASDDFFVLLDSSEGNWPSSSGFISSPERIDMGVGRLPVQTPAEARVLIQKIQTYEDPANFGDWRTLFTFSSDDDINGSRAERDLHVWNAEGTAESIDRDAAGVRINKIYQINYPIINTPLGRLAPEATAAFISSINSGTLVMNYSGHGSEQLLSAEQLFRSDDIPRLNNSNRLTIMVTATCDFGRFDDVDEQSGAEKMMLYPNGGAVASFTTTRVVFTSENINSYNFGLNVQLSQQMASREPNGLPQTMGDIYRKTKNTTVGASFNSRKFILLGDPSMRIGLPQNEVKLASINDTNLQDLSSSTFRLRALDQAVLSGFVSDGSGGINTAFNGEASVQVYDANRFLELPNFQGRENGCITPNCQYRLQNDVIFSGLVTVTDGRFSSRFIVPNDIAYSEEFGRILVYSQDQNSGDAVGSYSEIVFNGRNPDAVNDGTGPVMQVYLNDESFADGGLVNDSPKLIINLEDQSGINTAGAGVGHELVAELSMVPATGNRRSIILNNFYRSELDDFTKGRVEYPLDRLENGVYSLKVRAWDVFNNLSEQEITFEVASSRELEIRHAYNYPNPMSGYTRFVFEHNQAGHEMDVLIRVFTLSGRPVARMQRDGIITSGNLVQIPWNGFDDDGNRLAAGTYLYHVRVRSYFNGTRITREKTEKLVIIR